MIVCHSTQEKRQFDLSHKCAKSPVFSSTEIPSSTKILDDLPHSPPKVGLDTIEKMTDINMLSLLESRYDEFLEKNSQIMLLLYLDNIIDEYIEIRNALTIRVSRLSREKQLNKHFASLRENFENMDVRKLHYCEYDHTHQSLLPEELQLTQQQILNGYIPCPNEPKEFKCGCLSIKYYSQCYCKTDSDICDNLKCSEKYYPLIKLYSYCEFHKKLTQRLERLESETEKTRKELSAIKRQNNSLDYEDYKNSLSKNKKRRISRLPWKNIYN